MRANATGCRLLVWTAILGIGLLRADPVPELELVRHGFIPVSEQIRISEWFTGRENPGRRQYLRSDPSDRSGYYFVLRIPSHLQDAAGAVPLAFSIEIFPGGTLRPLVCDYPVPAFLSLEKPFYLGITGDHWAQPDRAPIAWKIVLHPAGTEHAALAQWKSHLWSDPVELPSSDSSPTSSSGRGPR